METCESVGLSASAGGLAVVAAGLLVVLTLGACTGRSGQGQLAQEIDPFELSIRIGRLGVMLDQGQEALDLLVESPVAVRGVAEEGEEEQRMTLYRDLVDHVVFYNQLAALTCAVQSETVPVPCPPPYRPKWAARSVVSDAPSWSQLDRWSEALQERVAGLAGALCRAGERKTGRVPLCPIE